MFDNYDYRSGEISGHLLNYDNTLVPSSTMKVGGFPTFELDNSQTKLRIYYGNAQSTERNVKGAKGPKGNDGITYKPHLEDKKLSWVIATDTSIVPTFDLNQLKGDPGVAGPTGNHRKFTGTDENGDLVGQRFDYSGHSIGSVGTFPRPHIEISGDKVLTKFNGKVQGSVKIQPELKVISGDLKYRFNTSDQYTNAGKVEGPSGPRGPQGNNGLTYKPSVSSNGDLSWKLGSDTGDVATTNIQGPRGPQGNNGKIWKPTVSTDGNISWDLTDGNTTTKPADRNITGPKGDNGKDGLTYHPIITPDKHLKWSTAPTADTTFDLEQLRGPQGIPGNNGLTYKPSVSTDGKLS